MIFVTIDAALFLHRAGIKQHGGTGGVRDIGLLESALATPKASWRGEYLMQFPYEMAGSYLVSIARNHPFVDGNKRTASSVALLFLALNNLICDDNTDALVQTTLLAATGQINKKQCGKMLSYLVKN